MMSCLEPYYYVDFYYYHHHHHHWKPVCNSWLEFEIVLVQLKKKVWPFTYNQIVVFKVSAYFLSSKSTAIVISVSIKCYFKWISCAREEITYAIFQDDRQNEEIFLETSHKFVLLYLIRINTFLESIPFPSKLPLFDWKVYALKRCLSSHI